jgi:hypothetical protein
VCVKGERGEILKEENKAEKYAWIYREQLK